MRKFKKQRNLTDIQLKVIEMKMSRNSNAQIAAVIGVHPDTVSCKWRDIQKGIAKGAYRNLPDHLSVTGDLFEFIELEFN